VSYFFFLSFREISVVKVKKKTFAIMLMKTRRNRKASQLFQQLHDKFR